MLCVPVEQAVTMHRLGPLAPSSMAICPDAVSGSMLAMKKGLTDFGPFWSSIVDGLGHERPVHRPRSRR